MERLQTYLGSLKYTYWLAMAKLLCTFIFKYTTHTQCIWLHLHIQLRFPCIDYIPAHVAGYQSVWNLRGSTTRNHTFVSAYGRNTYFCACKEFTILGEVELVVYPFILVVSEKKRLGSCDIFKPFTKITRNDHTSWTCNHAPYSMYAWGALKGTHRVRRPSKE